LQSLPLTNGQQGYKDNTMSSWAGLGWAKDKQFSNRQQNIFHDINVQMANYKHIEVRGGESQDIHIQFKAYIYLF